MHLSISSKKMVVKILWTIIAMLFLIMIIRCAYVNAQYPSPNVQTYRKGEFINIGNYKIALTDWKWGDGEIIHEVYPGYTLVEMDGQEYATENERVGLAEVTIDKIQDDNTSLDLSGITFESGAWGNQFDYDLFMHLNPDLESLVLKMEKGEKTTIIFPITMLDIQFSEKSWKNIDERPFYIVIQYYPENRQLLCV